LAFSVAFVGVALAMEMTKAALQELCKQNKLYRTPGLNDKLYCNFKGFSRLGSLEEYVHLTALFLEGNCLSSLDGLPFLEELKCL
jgi:dynein assembly factor 1